MLICISRATVSAVSCLVVPAFICIDLLISLVLKINDDDDDDDEKLKMVSFHAFWVAISYCLAACFTEIRNTCVTDIYWRSFQHFGNYNYSLQKIVHKKCNKNY